MGAQLSSLLPNSYFQKRSFMIYLVVVYYVWQHMQSSRKKEKKPFVKLEADGRPG
mgnify:CR=1 FL=1